MSPLPLIVGADIFVRFLMRRESGLPQAGAIG